MPSNHTRLDAFAVLLGALLIAGAPSFAQTEPQPTAEDSLQIMAAGAETSEDAPFVSANYRFLPGDYVYFQFQISGYAVKTKENSEIRKISLTYDAIPQDANGIALTPPVSGVIAEDLGAEDKNWTPKRRGSFLLPSFMAAGPYHLHLVVHDQIGNKTTERDLIFQVGGTVVAPVAALSVQDFQFTRKEDDSDALDVPAFRAGDTVFIRFLMTGFHVGGGNEYRLSYGVTVNRPDGKVYLNEPNAAQLGDKSFYPAAFVPGNLSVTTTRTSAHGEYTVTLNVRDLTNGQTYQVKRSFSIE